MIIHNLVPPDTLTGFIREVPTPANWILNQFLPDREIADIEAVIDQVTKTNRAAKFRSFDAETPIGARDSFTRKRVELPPLGQKTVIGEHDRLQLERIRTGGNDPQGLVEAIYDDAEVNARAVRARMELARGDVLTDGKLTLTNENGLTIEADFGVPGTHIVAPGTLWSSTATATVLSDLRSWANTYVDDVGEPPGALLTSRQVVGYMLQNAEIRALVGSLAGTPNIVTRSQLNTALEAHGLPPVVEYDTRIDVDGTSTRPIPQDRLVMLPADPSSLGYTAWGITAEALELAGGDNPSLEFTQLPGLVGVVMKDGDPVRTWTKVTGVGMPVIVDPYRLLVADVA
jgi:hypothetical protein